MLTETYISLANQIRTEVPSIKHIDLYNNQYTDSNSSKELPFVTPAVFIEFGDCEWVEQGKRIQEADTILTLHIVTQTYQDTRQADLVTDPVKLAAIMAPLRIDNAIHAAVQKFLPDGCCREMWRVGTQYDNERTNIAVMKVGYHTRLREEIDAGMTRYVPVTSVGVAPYSLLLSGLVIH